MKRICLTQAVAWISLDDEHLEILKCWRSRAENNTHGAHILANALPVTCSGVRSNMDCCRFITTGIAILTLLAETCVAYAKHPPKHCVTCSGTRSIMQRSSLKHAAKLAQTWREARSNEQRNCLDHQALSIAMPRCMYRIHRCISRAFQIKIQQSV